MHQIYLKLKDGVKDSHGAKVATMISDYLNLQVGNVKCGKIFMLDHKLSEEHLEKFAQLGLCDPVIHNIEIDSTSHDPRYASYILVAKLPGVTDDEGMSAQKTLNDILDLELETNTQHIYSQELYLFEKQLNTKQLNLIAKEVLGNPLINHFEYGKTGEKIFYLPDVKIEKPQMYEVVSLAVNDDELMQISKEKLLSLNLAEMQAIRNHYVNKQTQSKRESQNLPKDPTDCELEILAQTWSEHCKHKEFNAIIEYNDIDTRETFVVDSLFDSYIKASTKIIQKRLQKYGNNWLLKVFSDNAGVVKIDDKSVFVWKVETHNSPSAIDPYGGAITGILGNNRDPLGTGIGGGKLLFNTNVLCFGPPDYDKPLLPGQLHPRQVFMGVRHGIEDGGNKSGIPTVNGSIIFDERYSGKPLVYCGTGGVMPYKFKGRKSWEKRIDAGDLIIMAGGRVGKDGIHGATFSSAEIDEHSPQSAVQIGSPITQKLLSDFMQEAAEKGLIKCSTDNGAGGLSSSVGELAQISGGALVNLEKVPLKYLNLRPWEIFVSESQERMTLVVEENNIPELYELAKLREVELAHIGYFTDDGYLDVRYDDQKVAYLKLKFLHDGVPRKRLQAQWKRPELKEPVLPKHLNFQETLIKLLSSYNICSREWVIRQYDHEVKGKTILKPLMGRYGKTPQDAAVMRLTHDSYEGIAISNGIIPRYGDIDAYQMSAGAFDEAIRQIISVGGQLPDVKDSSNRFWTVNDNFCVPDSVYDEKTNPDGKIKLAKLVQMNMALYDMATHFDIPLTSGKDSMKNDFKSGDVKISVPPTVLYSIVAKLDDVRKTTSSNFKQADDLIYIIGKTYNEMGGSEFYKLLGHLGKNVPVVRKEDAKKRYLNMTEAHRKQLLRSAHDISDGGMIVALAESVIGTDLGVKIHLDQFDELFQILFSESHSRFIISVKEKDADMLEKIFENDAFRIGKVTSDKNFSVSYKNKLIINCPVSELQMSWESGLELR
jgi:phosphoribosylformylglycinamidine synthase